MTSRLPFAWACLLTLLLGACAHAPPHVISGGAEVKREAPSAPAPGTEPKRVYVQDFKLDVAATEQSDEVVQRPRVVRELLAGDPAAQAPRRAIIGFGAGASEMQAQVGVNDLAHDPEQSFAVFGTITDPSRLPGGVVTRNPYVVGAKFVLEKNAPQRDIEHTAKAIADEPVKFRNQARAGAVSLPPR